MSMFKQPRLSSYGLQSDPGISPLTWFKFTEQQGPCGGPAADEHGSNSLKQQGPCGDPAADETPLRTKFASLFLKTSDEPSAPH